MSQSSLPRRRRPSTMTTTPAHQPSGRRQTPPRSSHWRWIPIAGSAGWVLAVTIGTALAPAHYNSVRDTISALAAVDNPYGGVMVAGFITMAIGLAATAVGLWRRLPVLAGRIAAAEVGIAAAATLVAGLNRIACNPGLADCQAALEHSVPTATIVHGRAALFVFAPLVLAGFSLTRATWRVGDRRLALLCLTMTILNVGLVFLAENAGTPASGLLQRLFITTVIGVPMLVQWRCTDGRCGAR